MTTRPDDDELISAVLDGEATPEEVARVEGDPRLAERLAVLRATAMAVAAPVAPLDELTAARLRSAALESSTPRTRGFVPWLAVAAAILLVVGLVGALGGGLLEDDAEDQFAGSEPASSDEAETSAAVEDAAPGEDERVEVSDALQEPSSAGPDVVPTTTVVDVGGAPAQTVAVIEPPAALDEASFATWADGQSTTVRRAPALELAYASINDRVTAGELTCTAGPGEPIASGTTTYQGSSVELSVWLGSDATGERVVHATVSDATSCEVLIEAELTRR